MEKYQQVPTEKLQKLEEARLKLYEIARKYHIDTSEVMQVSGIMWELSHKKWNNQSDKEGK